MKCPNIDDIDFSNASIASLNEIKRIQDLSSLLSKAVGLGSLANIFVGNNLVAASYSVYSHDFAIMTKALKGASALTRSRIETVAGRR